MTIEQIDAAILAAVMAGNIEEAQRLGRLKLDLQKQEAEISDSETPIYDTLVAKAQFPVTDEKKKCVEDTVAQLMEEGPHADEPGLLLGKIQCGKTDTFENIIGLAFDKGVDIAIILTKGTKALAKQTLMRLKKDFRWFEETDNKDQKVTVKIHDIMNIKGGLKRPQVEGKKTVIVCKKQSTNLDHLINLFTKKSPFMKDMKVLVVDDEADFASRNYKAVRLEAQNDEDGNPIYQDREYEMAKISQQIDDFRGIPSFCRYLQVTATPYCLYLQPQGELCLNGNKVMPFKPRFTSIVPVHGAYIGGQQYFEDAKDPESMYSHLFHMVEQKCVDILGHEDQRYINSSIASKNLYGLTYSLVSYLMATSIRMIQMDRYERKSYQSSALIHVEIDKKNHGWQKRIIDRLLKDIKAYIVDGAEDGRVKVAVDSIYDDFVNSNAKGKNAGLINVDIPTKEEVLDQMKLLFVDSEIHTQVVNSDEAVSDLLNEKTGELQLTTAANIFIGGNILDRGITIKNMISFFYGRNPKTFQQDTVLQHARMYGARSKEDMAVTRLHTTGGIYKILVRMNELDEQLRQWFIEGKDQEEPNAVFVGFDKDIKPCSSQKIKASNTITLKKQQRVLPVGFFTGSKTKLTPINKRIDSLITNTSGFANQDANGFFEIDKKTVFDIIKLIQETYVYDEKHGNKQWKNDLQELMCAIEYCCSKSDDKLLAIYRTDRNMSRVRENGYYVDAPEDGRTDLAPAKERAIDIPVIMFFQENGRKDDGWNDAPFYWPVLLTQEELGAVVYAFDTAPKSQAAVIDIQSFLAGIDKKDVLDLTFKGDLEECFGIEGSVIEAEESREIKENTAARYLEREIDGSWALNPDVDIDKEHWHGIYSLNNEKFPFVLRPYKYLLLRRGRDANADLMLLQLDDPSKWEVIPEPNIIDGDLCDRDNNVLVHGSDILMGKDLTEVDFMDKYLTTWIILYKITKVLKSKKQVLVNEDDEQ